MTEMAKQGSLAGYALLVQNASLCIESGNDIELYNSLHFAKVNPNAVYDNKTLLRKAVEMENVKCMKCLLDANADVTGIPKLQNVNGGGAFNLFTCYSDVIHTACDSFDVDVLKTLLEYKANPNDLDQVKNPTIMNCLFSGTNSNESTVEKIKSLLEHKADPNFPISNATPFSMVCSFGFHNLEFIDFFLRNGADPNAMYGGKSVLQMAVDFKNVDLIRVFLSHNVHVEREMMVKCEDEKIKELLRQGLMMKNLALNTMDMNFVHLNKALPSLQSVCIEALSKVSTYDHLLGHDHRFVSSGGFYMDHLDDDGQQASCGGTMPCKRKLDMLSMQ